MTSMAFTSPGTTQRRRFWLIIAAGFIVVALSAAGFIGLNELAAAKDHRDQTKKSDLLAWQAAIKHYQDVQTTLPTTKGEVTATGASGGLASLPEAGTLPKPPGKNDRYYYMVSGNLKLYMMCTRLEKASPKQSFFVNQEGSFTAPAEACRSMSNPQVAQFATSAAMTTEGVGLLYDAEPSLLSKSELQSKCQGSTHSESQFAGCYGGAKIYILDIDQPQIASEMGVTAAHEMLHAAYAGLSENERKALNPELEAQVKALHNQDLEDRLAKYDPEVRVDETHSLLGTEFAKLSEPLEKHYQQYFSNRQRVVESHQRYEKLLNDLNDEITRLEAQLDFLDGREEAYLIVGNIAAYNAGVEPFNALLETINQKIELYNLLTEHTRPERTQAPATHR